MLLAATLVGGGLRFYRLGEAPPGLYHDEAFNGLDALRILQGERPLFFPANNGREPLFFYGVACALAALGRTPVAVRVTATVLGTLLVPATFFMAQAMFNRWIGLWSAWLVAVLPWPVALSRIGLRAISLPLVSALAIGLWEWGQRQQGRRRWIGVVGGSACLGLTLYTYTAGRFALIAAAMYVLFQLWLGHVRPRWHELIVAVATAGLVMLPLLVYGVTHWDIFVQRPAQVSILNPQINGGHLWAVLARNTVRAAGLFVYRGDFIPRHNVPLRPLYDPLVSIFFILGVLLCLLKARRERSAVLAPIWVVVMLIPTILAEDCPHFLRAVGVLPMAVVFPALSLEWVRQKFRPRGLVWPGAAAVAGTLLISAVWGGYDYWVRYIGDPNLAYWFEADQVQAAVEINRFLGTGWQGQGISQPPGQVMDGRYVYLAPRIWENRLTTNLLVASPERVSILGRGASPLADEVLVLAWPHEDLGAAREALYGVARPARMAVWQGPLERGDLDAQPRLLYVAFQAAPLRGTSNRRVEFEQGIALTGWDYFTMADGRSCLRLRWQTIRTLSSDYTVFVHLVRDGQIMAQDDGRPGQGFWPTTWWRPGDELEDLHCLDLTQGHDYIEVGWYEWPSMQHLAVLDANHIPTADRVRLQ